MNNPIFPTQPALVNFHPVPIGAEFISYTTTKDTLTFRAWMPDGYSSFEDSGCMGREYDRFYSNHCVVCPRNTREYYEENHPELFRESCRESRWESGAVDQFLERNPNECFTYMNGFHGQGCPLGNEFKVPDPNKVSISNMVFDIKLYVRKDGGFEKYTDNAHLRAGYVNESGEISETSPRAAANVYCANNESSYLYGKICWNYIKNPLTLREIVASYFSSRFNSDLLRLYSFKTNIINLKEDVEHNRYHKSNHKFLCSGYDCLIMINGNTDVQAFFTMLMAGFTPLPEMPHIMIVPAKTSTIKQGDMIYLGYTTQKDSVGRSWYVSTEGYLIGQLDESFVTV